MDVSYLPFSFSISAPPSRIPRSPSFTFNSEFLRLFFFVSFRQIHILLLHLLFSFFFFFSPSSSHVPSSCPFPFPFPSSYPPLLFLHLYFIFSSWSSCWSGIK